MIRTIVLSLITLVVAGCATIDVQSMDPAAFPLREMCLGD